MTEKFNCEIGAADSEVCVEETQDAKEMRNAIGEDAFSATEGAIETDFEEAAGFTNDLPHELDPRSADIFFGKWNIPLDDYLRDIPME